MTDTLKKTSNKQEAINAIESRQHRIVELDYESGNKDIDTLGVLGRKNGVSVQYLLQEAITVDSESALVIQLERSNQTHKKRFFHLQFEMKSETLKRYQQVASKHGDVILPLGFIPTPKPMANHRQ